MSLKITFDGIDVTLPEEATELGINNGWNDDVFKETLEGSFTWTDDAYRYLLERYELSFCNQVDVKVFICDDLEFVGKIFLSEMTIDRIACTISASISDNSYDTYIKNKEGQKYIINIPRGSNGETITAASPVDVEFHNVLTGSYYADTRSCYDVADAMDMLISAMSNGELLFQSDFFTTGPGFGDVVVTGKEIRNPGPDNPAPEISWSELYGAMKKLYNLRTAVIRVGTIRTVRVEQYGFFKQFGQSLIVDGVTRLEETIDASLLYSRISIGSSRAKKFDDSTPNTSFVNSDYIGWDAEEYNIEGDCVVSNELDIAVSTLIIDSNSIQDQLVHPDYRGTTTSDSAGQLVDSGANFEYATDYNVTNTTTGDTAVATGIVSSTVIQLNADIFTSAPEDYTVLWGSAQYDDSVFLVRTQEGYGTRETVQFDPAGSGRFLYNGTYTNNVVLSNWENRIHNAVFRFTTGSTSAEFEAKTTAAQNVDIGCATTTAYWADPADTCGYGPAIPYDDVVFDPGSNFDGVTNFVYELPAPGTYLFQLFWDVDVTINQLIQSPTGADLIFTIRTHFYEETSAEDKGTTDFIFTDFRPGPIFGGTPPATRRFSYNQFFAYTGLAGDKVRPYIEFFNNIELAQLGANANFLAGCTFKSRGLIVNANGGLKNYASEAPITKQEWDRFKQNPFQRIGLSNYYGHLKNILWRPNGISDINTETVVNT